MNQPGDDKSFMDRGTIIAFILVIGFWFAWSHFMDSKYPQAKVPSTVATQNAASPQTGAAATPQTSLSASNSADPIAGATIGATPGAAETFVEYADPVWAFTISSRGMGLKNIVLKNYETRENTPIILSELNQKTSFSTFLVGNELPVDFNIEKSSSNTFVGRAKIGDLQIEKTLTIHPENFTVTMAVALTGAGASFKGVGTYLTDKIVTPVSTGFLSSSRDRQEFYVYHDDKKTRHLIHPEKGVVATENNVAVLGLSGHYFATAILDQSAVAPHFDTNTLPGTRVTVGSLIYEPINRAETFNVKYEAFAGPKSFKLLKSIDDRLAGLIDFGTFGVIGQPLLWLMKFFYSLFHNYGWAIIALTIVVRLIVMPFNVYSYRSMKVMQKIQPEMKALREKFKDEPTRMNTETMALMKKNKANPLGGCLPMLMQLPVFIALYQVLGQSIELYREPFIFWIHDLSYKDPYYVLPVLMGISMFLQQKLTPTAVDPQQAKIMMLMPVLFSFFMISLPSGLTLYIFVSTLFGITQQFLFLRDKGSPVAVARTA
jgi:YidC/Oxa1 family membrane protein insertase